MSTESMENIKALFTVRLTVLEHILSVGEQHFPDMDALMGARLTEDMLPLGTQVAFACNQPRGFSQWCAGQPVDNLSGEVSSLAQAREHIADTKARVATIDVSDSQLTETKRIGLGPGRYCELSGQQYVQDYLIPNLYFHLTTAYAIMRMNGAPLGKADFMSYLAPYVRLEK